MRPGTPPKRPKRRGNFAFNHTVFFVSCVAFPAFVTAIAPVSWVRLDRHPDGVSAKVDACCFFVIPYHSTPIDHVEGVGSTFTSGEWRQEPGQTDGVRTEDSAELVLRGRDRDAKVQVSPVNVADVKAEAERFLADPTVESKRMVVVANWKFGVIAGGLTSLLTPLYVFCIASNIVRRLKTRLTRTGTPKQATPRRDRPKK